MNKSLQTALAAFLLPTVALANDGIGAVGVGGIVFGKTDAIAMKKEVLTISHNLVSVDYEFLNESTSDVEESIVFPLPPYYAALQPSDTYYGQPNGFSIRVDGKPVQFKSRLAALSPEGEDITAQLKKLGLSDAQIAGQTLFTDQPTAAPVFSRLQVRQLTKLGLLDKESQEPAWMVKVDYIWKQKFAANKLVRVHHDYRPFVATGPGETSLNGDFKKTYCADQGYLVARARIEARKEYFDVRNVSYILTTGNTWKRGIEDFNLNVVKRKPDELVSLCFPGTFRKTDALTYQVRLSNFQPTKDLDIHFGNVDADDGGPAGVLPVLPP